MSFGMAGFCGGHDDGPSKPLPNVVPPPVIARNDLHLFYFGSNDQQHDETADHVTALMPAWGDTPTLIARAQHAGMRTVWVCEADLFAAGTPWRLRGDAEIALRATFDALLAAGINVLSWYVGDELERDKSVPEADIAAACALLRAVSAEYPTLAGKPLATIYGDAEDYRALGSFDWIGCDAYGQGADILTGQYARLKPRLRPDQRTLLVPGGASPWRQDPAPFLSYANSDPQVAAIVPFLWLSPWGGTGNAGIKDNGLADAYRACGQAILNSKGQP